MSRYASHSQEILYRDGKLVGFNAGHGFYTEHNLEYGGKEQVKYEETEGSNKEHPFDGEIVENPDEIHMMEFSDGYVWVTNSSETYSRLMEKTEEERRKIIEKYIDNNDKKRTDEILLKKLGIVQKAPGIVALWSAGPMKTDGIFDLISINEQGNKLLKTLYSEMQKRNVAISSDYSFLFKDRGLSFVVLNQLTPEDIRKKELVDYRDEMSRQFQQEYIEYLKKEGLYRGFLEKREGHKYPIEIREIRECKVKTNMNGEEVLEFYLEIFDISKEREFYMHELWNLTGNQIKALVPIVQSEEYAEYARNHSGEENEKYLIEKLALCCQREEKEEVPHIDKKFFKDIATEQGTETVEQRYVSLINMIDDWLEPDREDKLEKKGE